MADIRIISTILGLMNPVELVTPINLTQAKEGWLASVEAGYFTNPVFKYNENMLKNVIADENNVRNTKEELCSTLRRDTRVDCAVREIVKRRFDEALDTIAIAKGILAKNDRVTGKAVQAKYGRPSQSSIARANGAVMLGEHPCSGNVSIFTRAETKALKKLEFDEKAIASWFQRALDMYAIKGWCIAISNDVSSIDVRDKNSSGVPTIFIPSGRTVDGLKLLELIGHEINCHVLDAVNSRRLLEQLIDGQPQLGPLIPILAKSDDELLYEAHAKISDVAINGDAALPKPYYILAQQKAVLAESFCQIAHEMHELLENSKTKKLTASSMAKNAWMYTYRTLRGSTSVNNEDCYVFWKDYAYFSGYLLVHGDSSLAPYLNFSTMSAADIHLLQSAGVDLTHPAVPQKDIVAEFKKELVG